MKKNVGTKPFVNFILYLILILFVLFAVFPYLWMVLLSFKTTKDILVNPLQLPETLSFSNYERAFMTVDFGRMYGNTLFVVAVTIVLELTVCFMSSFALSKMVFKSKKLRDGIHLFMIAGLTISGFILLFPIFKLSSFFGINGTLFSLVLPYIATSISFNTLLLTNYLRQLPSEIDEAAVIDGCNLRQLIVYITLPLSKPVLATIIVFNVLYIWNEYPIASVLLNDQNRYTLSLAASFFRGRFSADYGATIAASLFIIIPQLFFYGFLQRYIVDGMTAGAVKG